MIPPAPFLSRLLWIFRLFCVFIHSPFITATKRIKHLRINLHKETKDLYAENSKTLKKQIKDNTNRRRARPCSCSCCSLAQSCPILCNLMDCSTPGFPVLHHLPEAVKLMSIESVMPSNHLALCHPLLVLPSIFPSIRVFSNESALCGRWPKY